MRGEHPRPAGRVLKPAAQSLRSGMDIAVTRLFLGYHHVPYELGGAPRDLRDSFLDLEPDGHVALPNSLLPTSTATWRSAWYE
ncbi:hypothetical protein SVIO_090450 [Streptomyces violaceusniger]|uniref:Uncharacterized protein n=1 Tax=Streptomyces violaceusniger TaxID=68280 RepID=A0A4D4LB01_STRVO|nr:hypothetical protein SVIO_090450 [Streptomyces violaceusniger]